MKKQTVNFADLIAGKPELTLSREPLYPPVVPTACNGWRLAATWNNVNTGIRGETEAIKFIRQGPSLASVVEVFANLAMSGRGFTIQDLVMLVMRQCSVLEFVEAAWGADAQELRQAYADAARAAGVELLVEAPPPHIDRTKQALEKSSAKEVDSFPRPV